MTDTSTDASDPGSLAHAVAAADAAHRPCTVSFAASAFPADAHTQITLSDGLALTGGVTIDGPGANALSLSVEPSGDPTLIPGSPIFTTHGANTVDNLTLGGAGNAAINASGPLTLKNDVFSSDSAEAIHTAGGGGAVMTSSKLTASDCLFINDQAFDGGSIDSTGPLSLTADTFDDDTSLTAGAIQTSAAFSITQCSFTDCVGTANEDVITDNARHGTLSRSSFFGDTAPGALGPSLAVTIGSGDKLRLAGTTFDGSATADVGGSGVTVGTKAFDAQLSASFTTDLASGELLAGTASTGTAAVSLHNIGTVAFNGSVTLDIYAQPQSSAGVATGLPTLLGTLTTHVQVNPKATASPSVPLQLPASLLAGKYDLTLQLSGPPTVVLSNDQAAQTIDIATNTPTASFGLPTLVAPANVAASLAAGEAVTVQVVVPNQGTAAGVPLAITVRGSSDDQYADSVFITSITPTTPIGAGQSATYNVTLSSLPSSLSGHLAYLFAEVLVPVTGGTYGTVSDPVAA